MEFTLNAFFAGTGKAKLGWHYSPWQAAAERLHRELQRAAAQRPDNRDADHWKSTLCADIVDLGQYLS